MSLLWSLPAEKVTLNELVIRASAWLNSCFKSRLLVILLLLLLLVIVIVKKLS